MRSIVATAVVVAVLASAAVQGLPLVPAPATAASQWWWRSSSSSNVGQLPTVGHRGIFGGHVELRVSPHPLPGWSALPVALGLHERLWVVEGRDCAALADCDGGLVVCVGAGHAANASAQAVAVFRLPTGAGAPCEGAVRVPLSDVLAPRARPVRLRVTQPDPQIAAALAAVSPASLAAFVNQLSAIFSRQSASPGALQAQGMIQALYASYGFQVSTFPFRAGFSANVIAELPGRVNPSKVVLMGAHYDSRSINASDPKLRAPGADDNGSGSANLLEFARVVSQQGLVFENTIRLCSFSGEEQGLLGSEAYAQHLKATGVDVVAMFNGDMLGYTLPGQNITLGMKDRFISAALLAESNALTNLYVPELPIGVSRSCCSDHQSFTEAGFEAIGFFENEGNASSYPSYHKATDLPENLNFAQVAMISRAMMASTMTFAVPVASAKRLGPLGKQF